MTDLIRVVRIAVFARHGVLDEEARLGQRFYVSLEASLDLREAGRSDDIADSVSYADMATVVLGIAEGHRFRLIEALADAVAREILRRWPQVVTVAVDVEKPSAPVPAVIDTIAVRVVRGRDDR